MTNLNGRRTRDRQATELQILEACETLLLQEGPEGIGVNRVAAEAGIGKQLIYRYFENLPGLVKAWLDRSANWPTSEELIGDDAQAFETLDLNQQVKIIQKNYVRALRKRPVILRIMASELMTPTELSGVLENSGDKIAQDLTQVLNNVGSEDVEKVVELSLIFYSMLNYLCIRSVSNVSCFGMDLSEESSWQRIDGIIDNLVDSYLG